MNQRTFTFRHSGDPTPIRKVSQKEVEAFARVHNVDSIAPGRFSLMFKADLLMHSELNGVEPGMVLQTIIDLEAGESQMTTKPATPFTREPLRGFWHKHFFSAHFVGHNIANHLLSNGQLRKKIEQVLDPAKHPVITKELLSELVNELVEGSLEERYDDGKLTGEWIIFAKHQGKNYYLCIALHSSGDVEIMKKMESICFDEFPFLRPGAKC